MKNAIKSAARASSLASLALVTLLTANASSAPLAYTNMTLLNSWTRYSLDTRFPSAAVDSQSVVHLRGAISSGTTNTVFVLPPGFRPNRTVYARVDMVNANVGRVIIGKDGTVQVQPAGAFANAQSFTSLEGVTFTTN